MFTRRFQGERGEKKQRKFALLAGHALFPGIESLEIRRLLSSVSWAGGTAGNWDVAGNWSGGAVPTSTQDVTINPASATTVTIQAGDIESVNSVALGAGNTLSITGGSLTTAADLTNSGMVTVSPGCALAVVGSYTQSAGATLSMPGGGDPTFATASSIVNSDFESPGVTGGSTTTKPASWTQAGDAYLSTQYAYTGSQSLMSTGTGSQVTQIFSATAGLSYTASVYAMTPASNKLTGDEYAELQIQFYNSTGMMVSGYTARYDDHLLTSSSATSGPLTGSVGNQGWNHFWTTAQAPANTTKVHVYVDMHSASGTGGGAAYFDDLTFGPAAPLGSTFAAGSLSNSGTLTIGPTNTVTVSSSFTQTSTGTLDIQLGNTPNIDIPIGNPPSTIDYGACGSVAINGAASLAGTLGLQTVYGYIPSTTDVLTPMTFASESGTLASYQLPSGAGYQFAGSVTFTNVVVSAFPSTPLTDTVDPTADVAAVKTTDLGINDQYKDVDAVTSQTQQMIAGAGIQMIRIPGGSASDDWHFDLPYSADINFAQLLQSIAAVGATGLATIDYGSASPQEGAAELAYALGSPSDSTPIGSGIQWNDATSQWQTVNWQTVGYWASLRAASPLATDDGLNFLRLGLVHPTPFTNVEYWEVGNEQYITTEIDRHGTNLPSGATTGAQHDPATYAAFAKQFASYANEITTAAGLPAICIGIDSGNPTGANDNGWTANVVAHGLADGFVPGFISDHNYGPSGDGDVSDEATLDQSSSDPASINDWTTRYNDYEATLEGNLSSQQAASVQILGTEWNSTAGSGTNSNKQTTSLVNGLFVANSIGSLIESDYQGASVWSIRGDWNANGDNSNTLYGWREGGTLGQLGVSDLTSPPAAGAYVPLPGYYALQLCSQIVQNDGEVVSATSNYTDLDTYAVLEPNGDLDLLVINTNPTANLTDQFNLTGFQPSGSAQIWQYGETQDTAQSQSTDGSSALANFNTTLSLNGRNFSYSFPAYSMTVIDLSRQKSTPSITLGSSGNPSTVGQSVTFTATVAAVLPATGTPTGTVTFMDGSTVLGAMSLNASGVAMFSNASLLIGSHSITASYSGDLDFVTNTSAVVNQVIAPNPVTVTSAAINGNNAALAGVQRSMVDSMVYTFSELVTLGADAFTIAVHTGEQGTAPTLAWAAINPDVNGASPQWVVTFTGASVIGNSIANGVYDITLNASAVSSEANPTAAITPRATDTFYRLYGDYNGDQVVNATDNLHFKNAITIYNPIFDYDDNGAVNATDNLHFKASISFVFNAPFTVTI
jgi:hypothetical protein